MEITITPMEGSANDIEKQVSAKIRETKLNNDGANKMEMNQLKDENEKLKEKLRQMEKQLKAMETEENNDNEVP